MARRRTVGSILAVGALVLGACTLPNEGDADSDVTTGAAVDPADLDFAVVTHAASGDEFWDRVESGVLRAGDDYGVNVEYSGSDDPGTQSGLIDQAVAQEVDGIVVSMSNPDALEGSVKAAVQRGIPVVSINSGIDDWEDFGAITHIGQSEAIAGKAAGEQLKSDGATKAVCVIHEAGNIGLEERCKAAAEGMGGAMENLQVDVEDLTGSAAAIKAKLQSDQDIDAVLTLNSAVAMSATDAVAAAGSKARVATFDLSEDVVEDIINGKIDFAVDQQPYVQGYLGISTLYLKAINGNDVGGGLPVNSGPAFVTKENAEQVLEFAKEGTR